MLSAISRELLSSLFADIRLAAVYALVIMVFFTGYRRYLELKDNMEAGNGKSRWRLLEEAILTGLVLGFALSIVSVLLGITISREAVEYFMFAMLVLVVINTRFVKFTYVAGVLMVLSAVTGHPRIEASSMLLLMGIVQLTEALLTYLFGSSDSIPVYIKHNKGIAGAFVIKKLWPLPIVFFTYMLSGGIDVAAQGFSPQWWALMDFRAAVPAAAVLGLDCFIGVTAYWDISITEEPVCRSRRASLYMTSIGIFLITGSLLSRHLPGAVIAAAAVAARECMVVLGRKVQKRGKPLFVSVDRGIRILEVFKGGNAEKLGLKPGDVILSVNGKTVQTAEGLKAALVDYPRYVWVDVHTSDGSNVTYEKRFYPDGIDFLNILTVPRDSEVTYNIDSYENLTILKNLVERFRGASKFRE